jgi:LuxR family transcriptional regulator, maltose regulon positive regulatory protein
MAEAPPRPGAGAEASRPAGLLATKLYVPRRQPGFVPRPRLVDRLDAGLARGLTLVCAPPGFGKSMLLADWAAGLDRPVAWLSLDAGDNDPARFWRHAVAALGLVRPGIVERLTPLLGPPPPPSFEGLVSALINELAAHGDDGDVILVLDDYHLIDAQAVHASVTFLLEHRPSALRVVLASRADPPLPLARLRVAGQLAELRAAELRFTTEEATALLREAIGDELPKPTVAALVARTEGWAAGLQLAGLSLQPARDAGHPLREQTDITASVAAFGGSHRYVLDYLTEEVLERQPAPMREFLLETSVLERLSGELCDAVTGRTGSQAMLEAIERANLFLVPLDEVRGWWRYHQLFADLLRARLRQQRPDRARQLHRNAAAWSEDHGLADDAVRHALAAGDAAWAARLVERHADALLERSEGETLQRWLAALPAELVGARPRLLLARANLALVSVDVEAFEVPLDAAERALAGAPELIEEPYEPSVGRQSSLLANLPAVLALGRAHLAELRGDAEGTWSFAARAQALVHEGEWMLEALVQAHLAVANYLRGRLAEAEQGFAASIARARAAGEHYVAVRACELLGQVQRARGRLDAALGTYQQVLEIAAPPGQPVLAPAGRAYVGMAEVAYQRSELDTALRYLSEGIPLCRQLAHALRGAPQPLATGLATLAWIRQAAGDAAGAREAMAEAEGVAPDPGVTSMLNPVPAQCAQLLLAQGDLAAAVRWTEQRRLSADDEPSYTREREYLVLARVLLAQDQPDQALPLLERLHAAAAAQGRIGSLIEVQALRALALAATRQEAAALTVLAEALTLAWPEGYIRVFADEGGAMVALLGQLVAAQRRDRSTGGPVPLEYLGRLVRAFEPDAAHEAPPRSPAVGQRATALPCLFEPLSERELEVLRLLAAGKRNREIAQELWVGLDTVKKHVTHILDKLGATNRTEATTRARELGLLP